MANPHRVHVPGGTYYLHRRTGSQRPIFSNPDDYTRFEDALRVTLDSERIKLLAYCWLPEAMHLVVEIGNRSTAGFMRALMWRYSRSQRRRAVDARPWVGERYHATLIRSEAYLVPLICQVHYLPVRAGFVPNASDYARSSHRAYLGEPSALPVRPRRPLALLGCRGSENIAYQDAMAQAPSNALARLFENGSRRTPIVLDNEELGYSGIARVTTLSQPRRMEVLDRLVTGIAEIHALSLEEICSKSRRREIVIARARITWLAMLSNLATLNEIASRLRHSPSALTRAATRYRRGCPELFTPDALARSELWKPQAVSTPARTELYKAAQAGAE